MHYSIFSILAYVTDFTAAISALIVHIKMQCNPIPDSMLLSFSSEVGCWEVHHFRVAILFPFFVQKHHSMFTRECLVSGLCMVYLASHKYSGSKHPEFYSFTNGTATTFDFELEVGGPSPIF